MRNTRHHLAIAFARVSVAVVFIAMLADKTTAVVIDDFSVGPITIVDRAVQTQLNLDSQHVLGGSRALDVGAFFYGSQLQIDITDGLTFQSSSWGYFQLKYDFTTSGNGVNLTEGGNDRVRITFGEVNILGFTPFALYASLPATSSGNGISIYLRDWDGLLLEFPFATFPTSFTDTKNLTLSVIRNPPGASFVLKSIVTAATPIAGDYDRNGVVDGDDYFVWRRFMGINTKNGNSRFPIASADGNSNGEVDAADYVLWRKSVGMTVPEPRYIVLPLSVPIATLLHRSRKFERTRVFRKC